MRDFFSRLAVGLCCTILLLAATRAPADDTPGCAERVPTALRSWDGAVGHVHRGAPTTVVTSIQMRIVKSVLDVFYWQANRYLPAQILTEHNS